jgi:DNA repair exonuclease SbcCD ATPase subunit
LAGGDFNVKSDDTGSFVSKALKSTKQIEETIEKCVITLNWKDKSKDQINITKDFSNYKDSRKVRYLSQSFIERKCHPERAEELQKEIEGIIFQHIPAQDRLGQTTFVELKKLKTKSIEVRKINCSKQIATLNDDIFAIEEEINSLEEKKEEKGKLETEIKQLEGQKPKPQTEEEKKIEEKLTALNSRKNLLNEEIAGLNIGISTIETLKVKVVSLNEYVQKELANIKKDLESIGLSTLQSKLKFSVELDFDSELDKKKKEIEDKIKKLQGTQEADKEGKEKVAGQKQINLDELTDVYISALDLDKASVLISLLESKSSIAQNARNTIKSFDEKIAKNRKRIEELDKCIKDIEDTKKPLLPTKKTERDTAYKNYFLLISEEKKILEDIYSALKEKIGTDSMGEKNQIDFFARVELDVNNFYNRGDKIIDFGRVGTYCRKGDNLFKEIKALAEKIEIGEETDIHSLITQLYKSFEEDDGKPVEIDNQLLKGKKGIDFYKWIFDVSDFKVTYSIKYQGTNIELLSPGKKGIVLLLMYLALDTESSIPLVIDQPEENLDNKSLYPHLVDYFKIAKKRRQMVIVTHNPNLVLNTDAEQIIVANFEAVPSTYKARITYISGAIENSFINKKLNIPLYQQGIREHGADILEGGKVAFIRRKDRYEY